MWSGVVGNHYYNLCTTVALRMCNGDLAVVDPQVLRNWRVAAAVKSGSPSEESSSGMPEVKKQRRKLLMRPDEPSLTFSMTGQLEHCNG